MLAQIPQTLDYQGRLEDNSGNPVADGSYSIVFSIYDAATNGNSLWTETRSVTTEEGFFNLTLGDNTVININTDKQIWLNISIGGNNLTPRTKLSGSLSSLTTRSVESTAVAGNSVISSINISDGAMDASKIADGTVSDAEYQYLGSVTSDIQTQINSKQTTITGNLDAALIADGTVSNAEYQYLGGVTSDIQTQINSKQATLPTQTGNNGKFLSTDGTALSWAAASGGGSTSLDIIELTNATLDTLKTADYVNLTDTQPTLEANALYLIKGLLGIQRVTSVVPISIKVNYSGSTNLNLFTLDGGTSDNNGLYTFNIPFGAGEMFFDGMLNTTTSGTLSIQGKITPTPYALNNTKTRLFVIRLK